MHLSEGILPIKHVLITSSVAIPFVITSYKEYIKSAQSKSINKKKILSNMAFSLCFAITLLPIPIPVAGASSHMCATPLLSLILGPKILCFPIFCVLLIQALSTHEEPASSLQISCPDFPSQITINPSCPPVANS